MAIARVQTSVWILAGAVALLLSSSPAAYAQAGSGGEQRPAPHTRLREAVERPAALQIPPLPDLMPTFRLTVEERTFPLETVLEGMRRDLGERPGRGAPAGGVGGVDLLGVAMRLVHAVNDARRRRAEADAREGVEEVLAQFCKSHDCSVTEPGVGAHEGVIVPAKPR